MAELRSAHPRDAPAIATVHVATWRAAYRGLIPDTVLVGLSVAAREQSWLDRLDTSTARTRTVLVTHDDAVLGFASTGPARDITAEDPTAGELYAIYLAPHAWGRGMGARLHTGALDGLRSDGFTCASVWVLDGNDRAVRFYRRQGWIDTGRTRTDRWPELRERQLHRLLAVRPGDAARGRRPAAGR
jgi:GNAT superfamily N-acetyltransferase